VEESSFMPRRALATSVCVAVAFSLFVPPASGGELERKRDDARRRQGELEHKLDLAHADEAALTRRIEQLDADLVRRRGEAETAQRDAAQAAVSVVRIGEDIDSLRTQLDDRRKVFNRRAVAAYMGGQSRQLDDLTVAGDLLAEAHDLVDAARREELVERLSRSDGIILGRLTEARVELATRELALVMAQNRARQRSADAAAALRAVEGLKAQRETTLVALQRHIEDLQKEFEALAAEQARLETLIRERLAAARSKVGRVVGAVSLSGFTWPVHGRLTSRYGPRWGRMHTGIDVAAPGGTPIGAAKTGTVLYTGWMGGYGNLVVVDHGDDVVTLYAHQSRVATTEGQVLAQGQTLGYVGSTGHSTGNHLHFEIRVDASPRDPLPYLP
jgi:murein DD-endopeptidase MepM/ murein hydrolase activator NlpD